jgi:hypothetical protein
LRYLTGSKERTIPLEQQTMTKPQTDLTRRSGAQRRVFAVLPVVVLACAAALWPTASPAQDAPGDDRVAHARNLLKRWVETQQQISKEKHHWDLSRQTLEERIELVDQEIAALREKIEKTRQSIADTEEVRRELTDQNEQFADALEVLKTTLAGLETRTRALVKRLPGHVRFKVQTFSQQLPEDPNQAKATLATRYTNVLGILNELNKLNAEITYRSERQDLPDGGTKEVSAVYVGIAYAYYVTGDGARAGVGTSTAEKWDWTPANDAAAQVAQAVAILQGDEMPAYVQLPLNLAGEAE